LQIKGRNVVGIYLPQRTSKKDPEKNEQQPPQKRKNKESTTAAVLGV